MQRSLDRQHQVIRGSHNDVSAWLFLAVEVDNCDGALYTHGIETTEGLKVSRNYTKVGNKVGTNGHFKDLTHVLNLIAFHASLQ